VFIARALCGVECKSNCLALQLLPVEVLKNRDEQLRMNWTIGECGNEETHTHESTTPYLALVTGLFTIHPE